MSLDDNLDNQTRERRGRETNRQIERDEVEEKDKVRKKVLYRGKEIKINVER